MPPLGLSDFAQPFCTHIVVKKCFNTPTKRRLTKETSKMESVEGAVLERCTLRLVSPISSPEHRGGCPKTDEKQMYFCSGQTRRKDFLRSSFLEVIEKTFFFAFVLFCFVLLFLRIGSKRRPFRIWRRSMVLFQVESVCSFFAIFDTTIIFCGGVARCCIGNFSCHAVS